MNLSESFWWDAVGGGWVDTSLFNDESDMTEGVITYGLVSIRSQDAVSESMNSSRVAARTMRAMRSSFQSALMTLS